MSAAKREPVLNALQLTDEEAGNINRAKHLLRMLYDLADPQFEDNKNWSPINRESLAVYANVVLALLPERF